ncbi:MAG: LPXTG cell wall anchor domain-containing protein [Clostridia bacterium]|nr:LPXTG cell wall anchor domain-containing protein [Clostridia bacterium]
MNREQEGYDLPKTGGIGTQPYTTAGMMLTVIGITSLLCINKKRERRRRA